MPIFLIMCLKPYTKWNVVGTQGKRNPRTIYEFTYNGVTQRIAVQVSKMVILLVQTPNLKGGYYGYESLIRQHKLYYGFCKKHLSHIWQKVF